ncbi:MAG TPA: ATP-dependent protease ATPase subunit HslU [Candidatus Micrarchaeaceae archaeon]|nr:ATP-dependent protease ATPase subunit HslU [Candidatus Micrarchaeaceae archaeon]
MDPELRPAEIVSSLDRYIVGQADAKRAMAIALRNRYRRMQVPPERRQDIMPSNILLIGPTGVGKTEIARRLAQLTHSPFIKVEATKFTEVGYVGRDVESIVRDLLEQTITQVQSQRVADVETEAKQRAEARIVERLIEADRPQTAPAAAEVEAGQPGGAAGSAEAAAQGAGADQLAAARRERSRRRQLLRKLTARKLDDHQIEIEVEESYSAPVEVFSGSGYEEIGWSLSDFFSQLAPPRKRTKRMSVADARHVLTQEETERLVDVDRVYDDSIHLVEENGIVFIDEVDKIAGPYVEAHGPDVSGAGVQRDLLPIIEGSTVSTRYGQVRTDHILFVAAGAFTSARPSDLIPEFQGRFPIRVELQPLAEADLCQILVEPKNALTHQYSALLATEQVEVEFSQDGVEELAHHAYLVNERDENIGARRLFTVMERVLQDVSFAAEEYQGQTVVIDREFVRAKLGDLVRDEDLRRYVL